MARSAEGLLSQIEEGALSSSTPLAETLRNCVALGGRANSAELRDWARRELDGYEPDDELPGYRTVVAPIVIDGATLNAIYTGKRIAHSALPEFAQEVIKEEVEIRYGVAQLEHMVAAADGGIVRLQHPKMPDLVRYMNHQAPYGQAIHELYWAVSDNSVLGVLDRTRTVLVSLVAEMRAAGIHGADLPSPEVATQAVNVVVHNAKRSVFNVTTAHSTGSSSAVAHGIEEPHGETQGSHIPGWIRGPWAFAVGAATIVAGVVGVAAWQGWNPI
ncbi:hypothetical protein [Nocardioides sp. NPDC006273]|uniref:AbiTii domain-containing protein n=1 Tax=Nocardioides sp. NPDC006273 TaxID=3155598 RepID=UPI0033B30FFA